MGTDQGSSTAWASRLRVGKVPGVVCRHKSGFPGVSREMRLAWLGVGLLALAKTTLTNFLQSSDTGDTGDM